jgi:radical SAM superfamily enzyme YgiQ (UPF0313 family)
MPYEINIPNPALGYLKGYLLKHDFETRNIYWNLLLHKSLIADYIKLISRYQISHKVVSLSLFIAYISNLIYKDINRNKKSLSFASSIIDPSVPQHELEELVENFKNQVDSFIEEQKLHKADVAGFTMKTNQWILNYYILQRLKEFNPEIKTIIGGIESPEQGIQFMKIFNKANFAIWGEGELPLIDLLNNMDRTSNFKKIPNIVYREKNKIVHSNLLNKKSPSNLDTFPFANHDDYFKTIKDQKLNFINPIIPIWGIRSCSWNKCKFCVLNKGYTYRERSSKNIVEEIEHQSRRHDNDYFIFVDNDFGRKNRDEFHKFIKMLLQSSKKREKPYHIIGGTSPLRLDKESIKIMKQITFDNVQTGFEATDDGLLKKMRKKHRFIDNVQSFKFSELHKFHLGDLNIIRNIPTETEEDIIKSTENLKFLRFYLKKYNLNLSKLILFKNSPFYNDMDEEDRSEWNYNICWDELKNIDFLSNADKFDFFGFIDKNLYNQHLWEKFEQLLNYYQSNDFTYLWTENPDGSSVIKENGIYELDKTETEFLKFCDNKRTYPEVKKRFSSLSESNLREIISSLNNAGFVYIDDNFDMMISIVSADYLKRA